TPATIHLPDDDVRKEMIQIINSVWDTGLMVPMERLPSLISYTNQHYRTDCCLETVRHVKTTPVLFLWMTAAALLPYYIPNAKYAVSFYIPSRDHFHALDLSFVLARFMDKYIREGDYRRFKLISFAFTLEIDGTYGLLLFDKKLRKIFKKA
ncbi:hypothetical protein B0H11DRAFT_1671128, partial [Mycena galericulata]